MNRRSCFVAGLLALLTAPLARAQTPPGYYVQQLTDSPVRDAWSRINNGGVIVYESRVDGTDESGEIFLFENGKFTRLTDDDVRDALPDLGDDGTIVWSRAIGPQGQFGPTLEIVRYKDGKLTRMTDDDRDDYAPRPNNLGQFVWTKDMGNGCRGLRADIFMYDGNSIRRLTTDGERDNLANQSPIINDRGEIVWTKYDFCPDPWESKIMFRSPDGNVKELTRSGMLQAQIPSLNNRSQASWHFVTQQFPHGAIVLWEAGEVSFITDWGRNGRLNDVGDMYFIRWHDDTETWQAWLYWKKQILQLSDDPFWNTDGDINNIGEVVWDSGPVFESNIRYMRRFPLGDLNCDGSIDLSDVEPFILALIDPDEYPNQHPDCDLTLGDINADGSVDLVDVEPFIELLLK